MCDTCGSVIAKGLGVDKMTPEIRIGIATNEYQKMIFDLVPDQKVLTESFSDHFENFRQEHELSSEEHNQAVIQAMHKLAGRNLISFELDGSGRCKIQLTENGLTKKEGFIGTLKSVFRKW